MKRYIVKVLKALIPHKVVKVEAKIVELAPTNLLQDRKALVTGGTSGIGFAIAKELLKAGASVCITGRSQDRIDKAVADLKLFAKSNQIVFGKVMDNCKIVTFDAILDSINDSFGCNSFDILVNNAGVQTGEFGTTTENQYDIVMDTNIKGVYFLTQCVAKRMKDNAIQGNILNIASASSDRPANSPYMLSKWGIKGFTKGLAKILIPYGITVNAIAPGATATPFLKRDNKNLSNPYNPIGRMITVEEISCMAVILLSGIGRSIVGDIIYMTGGASVITYDDVFYSYTSE